MRDLGKTFPSKSWALTTIAGYTLAFGLTPLGCPERARAEPLPQAVALPPHTQQPTRDASLSRELERALMQLGVFELLPRPAFDLEAVQLAIDCVDDSVECLRQVAERSHAQIVIAPSIERAHGAVVLSLLYFDAKAGKPPRKVARKQSGDELDRDTFDALPALLRQLLPGGADAGRKPTAKAKPAPAKPDDTTPPAEAEPEPPAPADEGTIPAPAAATAKGSGSSANLPLGPLVLGAGGVALLATSAIFGALVSGAEDDYAELKIENETDVAKAESELETGENQALVANVLLGAGAAALVGAGVWLALSLTSERAPAQTALVPVIGTDYAGLSLRGQLGARP